MIIFLLFILVFNSVTFVILNYGDKVNTQVILNI